jgi:TRAP-type mannitol/chloroaromatic compound transport system permease large subunit
MLTEKSLKYADFKTGTAVYTHTRIHTTLDGDVTKIFAKLKGRHYIIKCFKAVPYAGIGERVLATVITFTLFCKTWVNLIIIIIFFLLLLLSRFRPTASFGSEF